MSAPLSGLRLLITGAGTGIGAAIAIAAAEAGAIVAVHSRQHSSAAEALVERLRRTGGFAVSLTADLLDRAASRTLVPRAIELLGGLDGLVNNAGGILDRNTIGELTDSDWDRTFELNAHAPFLLAQAAFAHMGRQRTGRILNISSISVKFGGSSTSLHYACAKAALETMTVGLAKAGAPYNVLVNTIRPGIIATELHSRTPEAEMRKRIELIPVKRVGKPEEIAGMAVYLLSPASSFITGQVFSVSGGE